MAPFSRTVPFLCPTGCKYVGKWNGPVRAELLWSHNETCCLAEGHSDKWKCQTSTSVFLFTAPQFSLKQHWMSCLYDVAKAKWKKTSCWMTFIVVGNRFDFAVVVLLWRKATVRGDPSPLTFQTGRIHWLQWAMIPVTAVYFEKNNKLLVVMAASFNGHGLPGRPFPGDDGRVLHWAGRPDVNSWEFGRA